MIRIRITDQTGKGLLDKKLTGMPLRETAVIDATVEYYNDPYPCIVRRSAVMKIMFTQIEDMLREKALSFPALISDLPERFFYLVDLPEGAKYVSVSEA
jgi:hypothetical protein